MSDIRRDNFKRIATNRTTKIVDLISKLHNLANNSYYEYSDEQIKKMFDEIQKELDHQKELFENDKKTKKRIEL